MEGFIVWCTNSFAIGNYSEFKSGNSYSVQSLRFIPFSFLALLITACSTQATAAQTPIKPAPSSIAISQPAIIETFTEVVPSVSPSIACDDWQTLPIIPKVSENAHKLYQRGQASGNNPHAFSKIGDGEISTEWFFTAFDLGDDYYDLGPYQNLNPVIENFSGSFGRIGVSSKRGFNIDRILDPAVSDSTVCESGESPLTCELRLHQPAFAILSLGTNQVWQPQDFEKGMRQILNILMSKNVVPILSTKGDNLEGDYRINRTIACLAQEYDIPLWNFWAAIQSLPDHGLQPDLEHLTYGITDFDDNQAMQSAWTVRNLTALQVLDAVWKGVTREP